MKNPNRQIVTRDGKIVRILCTDRMGRWPVVALIRTGKAEYLGAYRENGRMFMPKGEVSLDDLFFAPKKKVYPFKVGDRVLVRDSDTSWDFIYGGVLVLITLCLVVPYAVDVQPTLKKHKSINANKVRKSVRSLVDYIKSAMQAPAISFAVAA